MKSLPTVSNDDCDDIFGPPRTYPTGYSPPKNRPSMISAKYRQKEERRKILKMSINKQKKIEDMETSLRRSVLVNNLVRKLQKESRDEKIQKQQLNYPRCYDNDNYINLKSEFMKNETKSTPNYDEPQPYSSEEGKLHIEAFVVETDFDTKLAAEINEVSAKDMEVLGNLVEENLKALNTTFNSENPTTGTTDNNDRLSSRKRSFDDMEDCDVQDVLSQFYMPPTPMMLTCIDDDEDVNVVDDQPSAKRERVEVSPVEEQCNSYSVTTEMDKISCNFLNKSISAPESRLRYLNNNQNMDTDSNSYSCGHASMLNELQSNVYHNLIASLET